MKRLFSLLVIVLLCTACSRKPKIIDNNYYGEMQNDRALMEIKTNEDNCDKYDVTISWSDNELDHYEWNFTIDSLEKTVKYYDCFLLNISFEESGLDDAKDGYIANYGVVYKNKSGYLTFDNKNNKVTWHSDYANDNAYAEDVVFVLSK